MKKNILFVISQFYKGGAEISLRNLLNHLDYNLLNVDFIIMDQSSDENNISLLDSIPKQVNVCNVFLENQHYSLFKKLKSKFLYTCNDYDIPRPALDFVRNKHYDFAFHIGEWWYPEFVAKYVSANRKAVWIHTDISKAEYFNDELFFQYFEAFNYYIFVSNRSMESSIEEYTFLKDKARVIYNINNVEEIRQKSKEIVTDYDFNSEVPTIITCANVRPEKNFCRQIEVMHLLKTRGIDFKWINIGAQADINELRRVRDLIQKYHLENDFILLGTRGNPYKYMKQATAVAVLSDYESWSMVITEAKILGVPVIATKTSGALEQIDDRVTGLLTEFDVKDIANKLEELLLDNELQLHIRNNIRNFDNTENILESFYALLNSNSIQAKNDILYIIDDVNYNGGAHAATIRQIEYLIASGRHVDVFSAVIPNVKMRKRMKGVRFLSWRDVVEDNLFNRRFFNVLTSKNYTSKEKKLKSLMTYEGKIRKNGAVFNSYVMPGVSKLFSRYHTVVVMSEASAFRKQVAHCNAQKKIQWIHTDYSLWSELNDWTKEVTKDDGDTYKNFTNIVLLSETLRTKFIACHPELADKTTVIKNILPCDEIIEKSTQSRELPKLKFVTVGRLSEEKAISRVIEVFHKLDEENYDFSYEIIGDGPEREKIKNLIANYGLTDKIFMRGARSNPFTYVHKADVFLLLSQYEGLPNTIYEAFILGTPVLATKVGGIPDQIIEGKNGWLVEDSFDAIFNKIKYILEHYEEVKVFKNNLKSYKYENSEIYSKINDLF